MTLATWGDVMAEIPPEVLGAMSEQDLKDVLLTVASDPSAGPVLLEAYRAAAEGVPESAWDQLWQILQTAATVANVVTSIGGVVTMVP